MKILTLFILLVVCGTSLSFAKEQKQQRQYIPTEYAGFMVYEGIDEKGMRVIVKRPVHYVLAPNQIDDNDNYYKYRDYRIEMQRLNKEQERKKENSAEDKRINNVAHYPLYFDE